MDIKKVINVVEELHKALLTSKELYDVLPLYPPLEEDISDQYLKEKYYINFTAPTLNVLDICPSQSIYMVTDKIVECQDYLDRQLVKYMKVDLVAYVVCKGEYESNCLNIVNVLHEELIKFGKKNIDIELTCIYYTTLEDNTPSYKLNICLSIK